MSKIINISSTVDPTRTERPIKTAIKSKPSTPTLSLAPISLRTKYKNESIELTPREKAIIDHCDMVAKIIVSEIMKE
jgi:hypothetical protein